MSLYIVSGPESELLVPTIELAEAEMDRLGALHPGKEITMGRVLRRVQYAMVKKEIPIPKSPGEDGYEDDPDAARVS